MPLSSIRIPPGVSPDAPDYAGKGAWRAADKIRFVGERAENIGGHEPLTTAKVLGAPRATLAWSLLNGTPVMAVATHLKLYIYRGGSYYDITPVRKSGTAGTNPIATTSGSSTVTLTVVSHGANVGDYFRISGASAVGGLSLNGEWVVAATPTADTVRFTANSPATSTATGGGVAVAYSFDLHAGRQHALPGRGFGMGPYGRGAYGTPREGSQVNDIALPTLSTWGEDLVACIGGLYRWVAANDVTTRAVPITDAPSDNLGAVVSPTDRHLMVFGAGGDPMTVQWPDQGTLTSWTPGPSSTANTLRLYDGSRIISAAIVQNTTLVWTDKALFGIEFVNQRDASHRTYRIASIDPPLGWNAVVVDGATARWMGANQFYKYDGRVDVIPTDVTETVFGALDRQQAQKVCAGTNYRWNEVMWFYPVRGSGPQENSRYAKLNTQTGVADIGTYARSTWMDAGVFKNPIAAGPDGVVYRHEIPNVIASITVEFRSKKYPAATPFKTHGPYQVVQTTQRLDKRMRGRAIAMTIRGTMRCGPETVPWFLESGYFDIDDGNSVMQVSGLVPDFAFREAVSVGVMRFDVQPDGEQ